jgi:hypothetical protein
MRERKRAQVSNILKFLFTRTFYFLSDADHLSLGGFELREDRVGALRELFETRVRVVQEDPGGRAGFVLWSKLGI